MAEPQPSDVHEGAATPTAPSDLTGAAALSSLSDTQDPSSNGTKKEVDGKALDKAMKELSVKEKAEDEKKKNVKIEAADVTLLVSELEVTKAKATELLRANDGDAVRAMRTFITAAP